MAKGKYHEWRTSDGLLLLGAWARDGLTDEQIAWNMGISKSTFYEWKKLYSDISEVLKKGKEVVDIEVENALLKRAKGYSYVEVTRGLAGGKLRVTKEVRKEVAPDVTAQIFWLKNRKPGAWRDVKNVDANVKTKTEGLSPEQLDTAIEQLEKLLGFEGDG